MTVKSVLKDEQDLTMTVTAEFDAAIEAVWQLWADPRKLERWWGPPTHPATVVDHALVAGGRVTSFMTGPDGDRFHGWWRIGSVNAPRTFDFEDGFADETGAPNPELPTTQAQVTLDIDASGRTLMVITTTFASLEEMHELVKMGMEEGITLALGQTDALLHQSPLFIPIDGHLAQCCVVPKQSGRLRSRTVSSAQCRSVADMCANCISKLEVIVGQVAGATVLLKRPTQDFLAELGVVAPYDELGELAHTVSFLRALDLDADEILGPDAVDVASTWKTAPPRQPFAFGWLVALPWRRRFA